MAANVLTASQLERLIQCLVDELGASDLAASELAETRVALVERTARARDLDERLRERDEQLMALTQEFEQRTAWALDLQKQLADRERRRTAVKSSAMWRAARALLLAPRSPRRRKP
jgi:hypothetical protein